MKSAIFLVILVFFLGAYFAMSNRNYNTQVFIETQKGMKIIKAEKVNNLLSQIPSLQEINYFETEKDIDNWFVRTKEKHGIQVARSKKFTSQGQFSMLIFWKTKKWGELDYVHFPENWSNYNSFCFDIFNPNKETFDFELKIGDCFDELGFYPNSPKFVVTKNLLSGLNRFKIPILDIAKNIDLYAPRKLIQLRFFANNKIFYIDNMRLEI